MEDALFDPDLNSLEEMIANQRWSTDQWHEPYPDETADPDDDIIHMIPEVPAGFRPAA